MHSISRRNALLAAAATGIASPLRGAVAGAGPQSLLTTAEGQVPGVYRRKVGNITMTAIADGYADLPLAVVPDADPKSAEALARRAHVATDHLQCVINTVVVQTPSARVLIDTGFGDLGAGHSGKIWENLRAAGIEPKSIDVLLVTHGHPDHTSGMLTQAGSPAFPNAELFMHARELAYWGDEATASRAPESQKPWFDIFRRSVAAYKGRTSVIDRNGQEIVPGLRVRELFGHTPGHCGLHVADGSEQHLFWTDIVHFQHLQFPRPDWGVGFDADPAQAVKVRAAMLDEVSADGLSVSGSHLVFPGFGYVERDGTRYSFEPARWTYDI